MAITIRLATPTEDGRYLGAIGKHPLAPLVGFVNLAHGFSPGRTATSPMPPIGGSRHLGAIGKHPLAPLVGFAISAHGLSPGRVCVESQSTVSEADCYSLIRRIMPFTDFGPLCRGQ